jgi:hypothetical protein
VKVSEHPKFSKYFKMLKVGLPPPAVKAKMQQDGVRSLILKSHRGDVLSVVVVLGYAGRLSG